LSAEKRNFDVKELNKLFFLVFNKGLSPKQKTITQKLNGRKPHPYNPLQQYEQP
jgi:hypothetical protein